MITDNATCRQLHNDLDYDDDTAIDCFELGQALQDLEKADLNDEHKVIAPFVREDSPDTRSVMNIVVLGDLDVEVIDVDGLDAGSPSDSEPEADLTMNLE